MARAAALDPCGREADTPLAWALYYARLGWLVFPLTSWGTVNVPLTPHGRNDANADPERIAGWWGRRFRTAWVGVRTGEDSKLAILDVDTKNGVWGFDALDELLAGQGLPTTPMAHTRSGGLHLYFQYPEGGLPTTSGDKGRGIGRGLEWKGDGGSATAPSGARSPYRWDEHYDLTVELAPIPAVLLPKALPERLSTPLRPLAELRLGAYGAAALHRARRRIEQAANGVQYRTLNREAFGLGQLVAGGVLPDGETFHRLLAAAEMMISYDPHRPWRRDELRKIVKRSYEQGLQQPRGLRDGR